MKLLDIIQAAMENHKRKCLNVPIEFVIRDSIVEYIKIKFRSHIDEGSLDEVGFIELLINIID